MRHPIVTLLVAGLAGILSGCASGAKKQLAEQQAQLATLQAQAGELTVQVHDRDAKITALESAKADAEAKSKELSDKLAAAQAQLDSLQGSNKELSKSLEADKGALGEQVKKAVEEKDKLAKQVGELSKVRARLSARLSSLSREGEALKTQLASLQAAADAEKAKADAADKARGARLAQVHEDMGPLADAVLKQIEAEQAFVEQKGETIELTLREPLLFEPGQAKLTDAGAALLDRLGAALHSLPDRRVRVEGHDDNARIKRELFGGFASHWDLSSARAAAVARYLHEHAGLDPRLLTACGFGEWRPVKANDTPEGRAANRRVVVVVEPSQENP